MATIGGAKAVGLDDERGSHEIGKQADVIGVDTHSPHLFPMYNPVSHLVTALRVRMSVMSLCRPGYPEGSQAVDAGYGSYL